MSRDPETLKEVTKGTLWRSSRPAYRSELASPVSKEEVDQWIHEAKGHGVNSIICLLGDDQLGLYDELPVDLISYYRDAGLAVEHVRVVDHQWPPLY
jgi:hypothetical protein